MDRKAIIDIGSNSIKFYIAEIKDGKIETVLDTLDVARLGEGLHSTGSISPEAMERNESAIIKFYERAVLEGCDEIRAVGTMALRSASNSSLLLKKVKDACDLDIEIIPGEEEARLSYLASYSAVSQKGKDIMVFDTGGGSTEFIFGRGNELLNRFSINLGAVRINEVFFSDDPVKETSVSSAISQIEKELKEAGLKKHDTEIVGIGGTCTTMASVAQEMITYNPELIQGYRLTKENIDEQIKAYESKTIEERKKITGLQPKRADIILAGACILKGILNMTGASYVTVSEKGLRHGLAFDLFRKEGKL